MTPQPDEFKNAINTNSNNRKNNSNNENKSLRYILGLQEQSSDTIVTSSWSRHHHHCPKVVGHRGALYESLENTRVGFLKCALDYKCYGVELDVFLLPKDGTLIVFHGGGDDTNPGALDEYCIGVTENTNIMDLTYNEALTLRFNPNFDEFPCPVEQITDPNVAYIPTLEQVLIDLKDTECQVKIELKGPNVVVPVLTLVERLQMQSQCCYSSFNLERLHELRKLRPNKEQYPTGALFDGVPPPNYIAMAQEVGATEIHLKYDSCSVHRIQEIHDAGFGSMAWLRGPVGMKGDAAFKYLDVGNEDEACYQALIDTGVEQICCNKPSLLQRMLSSI